MFKNQRKSRRNSIFFWGNGRILDPFLPRISPLFANVFFYFYFYSSFTEFVEMCVEAHSVTSFDEISREVTFPRVFDLWSYLFNARTWDQRISTQRGVLIISIFDFASSAISASWPDDLSSICRFPLSGFRAQGARVSGSWFWILVGKPFL